jgi:hypothetical protein
MRSFRRDDSRGCGSRRARADPDDSNSLEVALSLSGFASKPVSHHGFCDPSAYFGVPTGFLGFPRSHSVYQGLGLPKLRPADPSVATPGHARGTMGPVGPSTCTLRSSLASTPTRRVAPPSRPLSESCPLQSLTADKRPQPGLQSCGVSPEVLFPFSARGRADRHTRGLPHRGSLRLQGFSPS